jgi:hypothetical protein
VGAEGCVGITPGLQRGKIAVPERELINIHLGGFKMGQYFYVVNLTKKQYLHPHDFEEGLKLGEFPDTLALLSYLLSDSYGFVKHSLIGAWKGDSVQIAGDYSESSFGDYENLHDAAATEFEQVSKRADFREFFKMVSEDG